MERKEKRVYMDYTDSRGKVHKICRGIYPKQCDSYYEALERGDKQSANYLSVGEYHATPQWLIDHKIKMIELPYECEERAKDRLINVQLKLKQEELKEKENKPRYIFGFIPLFFGG